MIKRLPYIPKSYGLSAQNEPSVDRWIEVNARNYPDMYEVYNKFAKAFNLRMDQFILGNGAENVIKNVLLAVKPESLAYSVPTWNMLEVFCEALNTRPVTNEFKFENKEITEDWWKETKVDCLYDNCGITPLFKYAVFNFLQVSRYYILDCTYQSLKEIKNTINRYKDNPRVIIVCSLGKIYGAGARLGFAVFPKELNDKMQLQREQYLNLVACSIIMEDNFAETPVNPYIEKLKKYLPESAMLTDNFITLEGKISNNLNGKHFKIKEKEFTKFGIPNNATEYEALKNLILKESYEHFRFNH